MIYYPKVGDLFIYKNHAYGQSYLIVITDDDKDMLQVKTMKGFNYHRGEIMLAYRYISFDSDIWELVE